MNRGKYLFGVLILFLIAVPGIATGRELLEIWPLQIEVAVLNPEAQRAGFNQGSLQSKINLNIDTAQTGGRTWRLWLTPRHPPADLPVQVIRWEGRPPMINGSASPDQRVLAGQGVVDGRLVQTSLFFWAQGVMPGAGTFPVQFDFILEALP
jgi:hypothetical protein